MLKPINNTNAYDEVTVNCYDEVTVNGHDEVTVKFIEQKAEFVLF